MGWIVENVGERWSTTRAREEYRKGNVRTVVATIRDKGHSRRWGYFWYYNIYAIDGEGKWHRVVDDGSEKGIWNPYKEAWYETVVGSDRLYDVVLKVFGITVGKDEVPEIVRLFGYGDL